MAAATQPIRPDSARAFNRKDHDQRTQQGIDAHLGEQSGKQRGDHDAWRVIRSRQPEIDGKRRGLHPESKQIKNGERHQRAAAAHSFSLARQIRHVERAEGSVEKTRGDEKERRRNKIEDCVFRRTVDLLPLRSEDQQPERGDQEHLEPDIKIEDIPRKEGAVNARHHEHQEGIEAVTAPGRIDRSRPQKTAHEGHRRCNQGEGCA